MSIPAANGQQRWRNRRLERETDSRRARSLWILLLGIVAALMPLALYLVQQMNYIRVSYEIERVREEHQRFAEAERKFRLQRSSLECLERVESRARGLGLVQPDPDDVIVVLRTGAPADGNLLARAPDEPDRGR
jgi:hypothetical protein